MARAFDDGSSQYLSVSSAAHSSYPLALVAWAYSDDAAAGQHVLSIGEGSGNSNFHSLLLAGGVAGDPLRAQTRAAGSTNHASTSTGYSANTWHHLAGLFVSATDRRALIDNGGKGTDSTSRSPTGLDTTRIGVVAINTPFNYMSGYIAEAAVYDLSVWPGATDSDKADAFEAAALPALAAGYSPLLVPLGLVFYCPLIRDNDEDLSGGLSLTASGSPTVEAHPPVLYAAAPHYNIAPAAAAGETLSIAIVPTDSSYDVAKPVIVG